LKAEKHHSVKDFCWRFLEMMASKWFLGTGPPDCETVENFKLNAVLVALLVMKDQSNFHLRNATKKRHCGD